MGELGLGTMDVQMGEEVRDQSGKISKSILGINGAILILKIN